MDFTSALCTGLFVWSAFSGCPAITAPEVPVEEVRQVAPLTVAPEKAFAVRITGYNAVPEQTDSDPFTTASGAFSNPEVVAAVSQDLRSALPFGTVVVFETDNPTGKYCGYEKVQHLIGYRVVADTMNRRHVERMDILFDVNADVEIGEGKGRKAVNAAKVLASCGNITARVVGKIAIKDIPETQAELAMRVEQTLAMK